MAAIIGLHVLAFVFEVPLCLFRPCLATHLLKLFVSYGTHLFALLQEGDMYSGRDPAVVVCDACEFGTLRLRALIAPLPLVQAQA